MNDLISTIPIVIKNQHELLNRLSEGYKSLSKALMEYIDNSFDSGDSFYDEKSNSYKHKVDIKILIDRKNKQIQIKDNCTGMNQKTLEGLACNINQSEKRKGQKRAWVNGEFGLGAHAFRFFADDLIVISKEKNKKQVAIKINSDDENAYLINHPKVNFDQNGTLVIISNIYNSHIKKINLEELKKDIETYFERLLDRNVHIIIQDGNQVCNCQPFDYEKIEGFPIKKIINSWKIGADLKKIVLKENGVLINLKVGLTPIENKPPLFTRKGRRINQIHSLSSFINKTRHRKQVWSNPYLTGYIEVQNNLEVVITRDDFRGGKKFAKTRDAIYSEIIKLEDEIYQAIELVTQEKRENSLKHFASHLSQILSKLASEDTIKLQKLENPKGDQVKAKQELIELTQNGDSYEVKKSGPGGKGPNLTDQTEIVSAVPTSVGKLKGTKQNKPKTGIQVEFQNLHNPPRSLYDSSADILVICSNHPDFIDRIGTTKLKDLGDLKMTSRLSSYLAAVISSEYKEIFYSRKKLEPERKTILQDQIDFIFRFEEQLKNFAGQPLDSIGKVMK